MVTLTTIAQVRTFRSNRHTTIGFIPTMGYLHEGHLRLVRRAQKENDVVLVSIFVNPAQFGPNEDFQSYPRNTQQDLAMLKKEGVDAVFIPSVAEMYPERYSTYIEVGDITNRLEGKSRQGHFRGMATVVAKLFNIVVPTRAYFGQKDGQQVVVVKKMVRDLCLPITIVVCETVRESDGLAMSSRNVFLSQAHRKQAVILFQSLTKAKALFEKGERNSRIVIATMQKMIQTTDGVIDYISIADPESLEELKIAKKRALISLAVRFDKTRLIDNNILV